MSPRVDDDAATKTTTNCCDYESSVIQHSMVVRLAIARDATMRALLGVVVHMYASRPRHASPHRNPMYRIAAAAAVVNSVLLRCSDCCCYCADVPSRNAIVLQRMDSLNSNCVP